MARVKYLSNTFNNGIMSDEFLQRPDTDGGDDGEDDDHDDSNTALLAHQTKRMWQEKIRSYRVVVIPPFPSNSLLVKQISADHSYSSVPYAVEE